MLLLVWRRLLKFAKPSENKFVRKPLFWGVKNRIGKILLIEKVDLNNSPLPCKHDNPADVRIKKIGILFEESMDQG